MMVAVVGNRDVAEDAMALELLPELQSLFPKIGFKVLDSNEEWVFASGAFVLDVVKGIERVTMFSDLASFSPPPHITLHDFDAFSHLQLLKKLGKLPDDIKIIGIPQRGNPQSIAKEVEACLKSLD